MRARAVALLLLVTALVPTSASASAPGGTLLVSRPTGLGSLTQPLANDSSTRVAAVFGGGTPETGRVVSDDGRFVAFTSNADGLSPADDDAVANIYVRDVTTQQTILVSRATGAGGAGANGPSADPVISGDGRYVAFDSFASNLTSADTAGTEQVYVRDLQTDTTTLVSRADGQSGLIASDDAHDPSIDDNGGEIAFVSAATNLAPDANGKLQVYLRRGTSTDMVSRRHNGLSSPNQVGNDNSMEPSVSGDGTAVAFSSQATNLSGLPGDDGTTNVFVRRATSFDFDDGSTAMVDRVVAGAPNGAAQSPAIDQDGSRVAFISTSTDLVGGNVDTSTDADIYVSTGTVFQFILASRDQNGTKATAPSTEPSISDDGRRVAFTTTAALVPGDTNGTSDVYRRTMDTGLPGDQNATEIASSSGSATALSGPSSEGVIYPTGGAVAFTTFSRGVVASGPDDDVSQVYVHRFGVLLSTVPRIDWLSRPTGTGALRTGVTNSEMVGISRGTGASHQGVSSDGRYVAFASSSDELSPEDDDTTTQVYVRDTRDNTLTLASRADGAGGAPGNAVAALTAIGGTALSSDPPAITPDGRCVAFSSTATNISVPAGNGQRQVYVRDLAANTTVLASRDTNGNVAATGASSATISADCRRVAFTSSSQLDPASDTNTKRDVYVRDLQDGTTTLVSRQTTANGTVGDDDSVDPVIDATGDKVAFVSLATNLAPALVDSNNAADVFVRDLVADTTLPASLRNAGITTGDHGSSQPAISADGTKVAFSSTADDMAAGDANGIKTDVFVHTMGTPTTTLVSRTSASGPGGDDTSSAPAISADGTRILFLTSAQNLSGVPQGALVLRDLGADTRTLVSRADGASGAAADVVGGPALSPDGGCAAFDSRDDDLVPGTPSGTDFFRVYLRAVAADCPIPLPGSQPVPTGGGQTTTTTTATPPPDTVAPKLTGLAVAPSTFKVGTKATALAARRAPSGTSIRFTLSESAAVTLTIERALPGRRSGRRCVAPTRRLRHKSRCTRYATVGTLKRTGAKGPNRVAFSGRLGTTALKTGGYRIVARAADAAKNASATSTAGFRVVRR